MIIEDIDDTTQKVSWFSCYYLRQEWVQLRFNHEVITRAIKNYSKDIIFILVKKAEYR